MALRPRTEPPATAALKPRGLSGPTHATPPTWRWRYVLSAPHRLAFFAGGLALGLTALWWTLCLLLPLYGYPVRWAIAPAAAHGLVMSLGIFPFFFTGFLFTAGPRWLQVPPVPTRHLLPFIALQLAGWVGCVIGLHTSNTLAMLSMLLIGTAWAAQCGLWIELWHRSRVADRIHSILIGMACIMCALAMGVLAIALYQADTALLRAVTQFGLWSCIATIFVVVSHRMIPFFSASAIAALDAWRPLWLLWALVTITVSQGAFAFIDATVWPLPIAWRWLQVGTEAPAAILLLWLAVRWGLLLSLRIRLLAMLHGGFVWLGIALALQSISHTQQALDSTSIGLGLAPLHAMTMGFLGSTLLAMATRVICGHGGRPLVADNIAWTVYWLLQTAVLLRLGAALWPASYAITLPSAALVWATVCTAWALRYGRWLGQA